MSEKFQEDFIQPTTVIFCILFLFYLSVCRFALNVNHPSNGCHLGWTAMKFCWLSFPVRWPFPWHIHQIGSHFFAAQVCVSHCHFWFLLPGLTLLFSIIRISTKRLPPAYIFRAWSSVPSLYFCSVLYFFFMCVLFRVFQKLIPLQVFHFSLLYRHKLEYFYWDFIW